MGFQALFKFVKCWRAPDVVRETVPSSWGGDGERALAACHGNEILDKIDYSSAYTRDISKILAPVTGFSLSGYPLTQKNSTMTDPCCHGNEI